MIYLVRISEHKLRIFYPLSVLPLLYLYLVLFIFIYKYICCLHNNIEAGAAPQNGVSLYEDDSLHRVSLGNFGPHDECPHLIFYCIFSWEPALETLNSQADEVKKNHCNFRQ